MEKFCNVRITDKSKWDLLLIYDTLQILVPMNAECFVRTNENPELLSFINNNCRTTIDGQIPLWLYKKIKHEKHIEKISGSDIIYNYCKWAEDNKLKIFFLGGKQDSNREAILKIKDLYPNLNIQGYSPSYEPYPFSLQNSRSILNEISSFNPDIIFVGFGFGKQERWISDNISFLKHSNVKWTICCGGSFEFIAGKLKRAPKIIQTIGLESIWRLLMEPKLFRVKRLLTSFKIFKYAYS